MCGLYITAVLRSAKKTGVCAKEGRVRLLRIETNMATLYSRGEKIPRLLASANAHLKGS